jgi:hypothetical protein
MKASHYYYEAGQSGADFSLFFIGHFPTVDFTCNAINQK